MQQVRPAWLVLGLALVAAAIWWFNREPPEQVQARQERAEQAAAQIAEANRPAVYRWRDSNGVLQITSEPPRNGPYERITTDQAPAPEIHGDRD